MKIRVVMLGKTRRAELRAMLQDYLGRMRHYADVEAVELREDSAARRKLEIPAGANIVLLDAAGQGLTSEEFAHWLGELRDRGTRELVFLCGGAQGFPEALRRRATMKLSLSALTFSHELARVMLAEQVYRAFALLAGHPYPK